MTFLITLLSDPPDWLPWAILAVVLMLAAVVGLTLWWLFRRNNAAEEGAAEAAPPPEGDPAEEGWFMAQMRRELRRSLRTLGELTGHGGSPYKVPWIVVAGVEGADALAMVEGIEPGNERGAGVIPRAGTVRFCRDGAVFHAGDDLLATPAGLRRWRRLLRLMRLCRVHRPVDGLVVALPASMLAGPEALPYDRLADRGAQFYELIATVQRVTGLRVPVTVVVTRCDEVEGFDALVAALPRESRGEAVGWAVPYSLETAFQAQWADEAMDSIASNLSTAGVQLLLGGERPADPDGLMVLPSRVRAMAPRLKTLLAAMFQPSAYQESFIFRGLFLTGPEPEGAGRVAFAPGLFRDKVFREYQLVRPVGGLVTARTRKLRLVQAALAALLAVEAMGLAWVAVDTPHGVGELTELLESIEDDLRQIRGSQGADPSFAQAASLRLLQQFVRLDIDTITSPFAPTSYLPDPDTLMEQAISAGYDGIIMGAINRRLAMRLNAILSEDALARGGDDPGQQVLRAVSRLAEFDKAARTYEDLPKSKSAASLSYLARYALDIELPAGFEENAELYQAALAYSTVRPIEGVGAPTERAVGAMFAAAFRARFDERGLRARLERIAKLSREGNSERTPQEAMARLVELQRQILAVTRDLDSQNYGWINGSGMDLGPAFDEALAKVETLSVVPKGTAAALRAQGERRLADARKQLFSMLASESMPLLQLEDGKAVLAPGVLVLKKQVDDLLARSFMSETMPSVPALPSGARPILWDGQWLKTAQRLMDDYLAFIAGDAMKFPPELSFAAELAAFDQLNERVAAALAAAARPAERAIGGAYQVETELRGLGAAGHQLAGLADQMRRIKLESLDVQFEATVQTQAARLLAEVDAMAAGLPLLAPPPSFDWWDGSQPVSARAFRAASPAELAMTLEANREGLARIARDHAAPLIKTMADLPGGGGRGRELAAKWQGILRALARYDQKDRDSSLRRLETFILAEMDQVELGKCDSLAAGPPTPGGDLFAHRLDDLRAGMARRCAELGSGRVRQRYDRLHALFNETLANRFPFAADPAPSTPRADPAQVRRFFWAMAQDKPPARALVEAAAGRRSGAFLGALAESEKALAPMLVDPTLDQPLAYEVEAEFRANPAKDSGGNQIIDWVLDLGGDQRLSALEGRRKGVWTAGQPVRLSVRFARNAPAIPAPDSRGRYKVDGATATWEASDPWALLALMAQLRPEPGRLLELPDRRPHMLRLEVELQRNPDAVSGPRTITSAEMFLRLGLAAVVRVPGKPEEKVPVVLPQFPIAAPEAEANPRQVSVPRE